jgi:RNA polymerase sigma factor (sigma-70 family)
MKNCSELFGAWRRERSKEALIALLQGTQAIVYNLCFQVLRHPQDAEDASQRVFLDLLDVLPDLKDPDHYHAWLHRACFLTALNHRRSERRRVRHEKAPRERDPAALSDQDLDPLHEQLAHLEDGARDVLVGHYFECRTLADLAQQRGCSVVAVWKQIRKAEEVLGRSLRQAGYAPLALPLGVFLAGRRVEAAPQALLSESVLAKAASVTGDLARFPLAGPVGILSSGKSAAVTTVMGLLVVSLLGYTVYWRRQISRDALEGAAARKPLASASSRTGSGLSSPAGARPVDPPESEAPVARFDSFPSFRAAFQKAAAVFPEKERWREWRRIGLRRSDDQFCSAMARLHEKTSLRRNPDAALRMILRDWMESEPTRAAAFLTGMPLATNPRQWDSWSMLKPVLDEWSRNAPGDALAFLNLLPSEWPSADAVRETQWRLRLKSDPGTFLQWLRTEAAGEERDGALTIAIPYWASKDPLAAAAWVEQLPAATAKNPLGAIAREWARTSPEAALGWARKYLGQPGDPPAPYQSVRAVLLKELLLGAVGNDPEWAAETAFQWGDRDPYVASAVLKEWAERDAAALARFLDRRNLRDPRLEAEMVDLAATEWAQTDPRGALAWAQNRGRGMSGIFCEWARADDAEPGNLYTIIGRLPDALRVAALNGLVAGWAQYDPAAAARFIDAIPAGGTTPTSVSTLVRVWASLDLEASIAWVRKMPPAIRDDALRSASLDIAFSMDVAKAMTVAAEISEPTMRDNAQADVLEFGAIHQPQAAAAVLASIPAPGTKAYRQVADGFLRLDPAAGLAWAQSLPEIYREFPSRANPLPRPYDHPLRSDITKEMLLAYSRRDAPAAARWVEQASLPAAMKTSLLAELQKQRP